MLGLPFWCLGSKIDVQGNEGHIEVERDGGIDVLHIQMPLVISAAKGMAEARIPNMRGIMAARTKPIIVESAQGAPAVVADKFALPGSKSAVKLVSSENMEELVQLLHNEAKVL